VTHLYEIIGLGVRNGSDAANPPIQLEVDDENVALVMIGSQIRRTGTTPLIEVINDAEVYMLDGSSIGATDDDPVVLIADNMTLAVFIRGEVCRIANNAIDGGATTTLNITNQSSSSTYVSTQPLTGTTNLNQASAIGNFDADPNTLVQGDIGMLIVRETTGVEYINTNGTTAWAPNTTPQMISIVKSADQDVTNASNTDDTELQFPVVAGKIYAIEAMFIVSGNDATGDFEFRFAASAGTMDGRGNCLSITTADATQTTMVAAVAAATATQVAIGTAADQGFPIAVKVFFAFRHNTTSGLFKVQFGNNVAAGGRTSRMFKGSYLQYKLLN
jgi:hypothetical protein